MQPTRARRSRTRSRPVRLPSGSRFATSLRHDGFREPPCGRDRAARRPARTSPRRQPFRRGALYRAPVPHRRRLGCVSRARSESRKGLGRRESCQPRVAYPSTWRAPRSGERWRRPCSRSPAVLELVAPSIRHDRSEKAIESVGLPRRQDGVTRAERGGKRHDTSASACARQLGAESARLARDGTHALDFGSRHEEAAQEHLVQVHQPAQGLTVPGFDRETRVVHEHANRFERLLYELGLALSQPRHRVDHRLRARRSAGVADAQVERPPQPYRLERRSLSEHETAASGGHGRIDATRIAMEDLLPRHGPIEHRGLGRSGVEGAGNRNADRGGATQSAAGRKIGLHLDLAMTRNAVAAAGGGQEGPKCACEVVVVVGLGSGEPPAANEKSTGTLVDGRRPGARNTVDPGCNRRSSVDDGVLAEKDRLAARVAHSRHPHSLCVSASAADASRIRPSPVKRTPSSAPLEARASSSIRASTCARTPLVSRLAIAERTSSSLASSRPKTRSTGPLIEAVATTTALYRPLRRSPPADFPIVLASPNTPSKSSRSWNATPSGSANATSDAS